MFPFVSVVDRLIGNPMSGWLPASKADTARHVGDSFCVVDFLRVYYGRNLVELWDIVLTSLQNLQERRILMRSRKRTDKRETTYQFEPSSAPRSSLNPPRRKSN